MKHWKRTWAKCIPCCLIAVVAVAAFYVAARFLLGSYDGHLIFLATGTMIVVASFLLIFFEAKSIDIFWFHQVYRALAVVLCLAFALFASLTPPNEEAAKQLLVFIAAAVALFLAARSGRVSERQLQQSRFENAINMLASQSGGGPPAAPGGGGTGTASPSNAALVLLDDLPKTFLFDKRHQIADVLVELKIRRSHVQSVSSLVGGNLDQALEDTNADP